MQLKLRLFQFLLIFVLTSCQYLQGQNATEVQTDTSKARRAVIDLGDIPIRSAELKNKTTLLMVLL